VFQGILYCLLFLFCMVVLAKIRSRGVRQTVLLIASYVLYVTWDPWFAVVLLTSTVVNFLVGRWLRRTVSGVVLTIGIILNLILLGSVKYLPEAAVHLPFSSLQRFSHLALPLGLSFWTFQAMSYLFDLYRGEELDPSFFEFALYMVFFPVTISGPICRMPDMLPQFRSGELTRWDDISHGFRRIATGVFMVQLAKLLGQGILGGDGITSGFDRVTQWSGTDVWCLAFGYGLQLFFDFAGYSHIAIGAAQAMGFTVPENFAHPFQSTNASIFWTRWHMSLSFWIRDYVFLPLAMLRREMWWRNLALVIAMVLFGLWHKASVLFLLWGAYHGVLLVLHRQVQQVERRLEWDPPSKFWVPFSWIATMAVINLGWIFFRSNSLPAARQMLAASLSPASYGVHRLSGSLYLLVAAVAVGYAIALWMIHQLDRYSQEMQEPDAVPASGLLALMARGRWFWLPPLYALALLFLLIVTFTRGASTAQFMYNKF
jgi:D-alanyl-lipoteichoic acid acyltransferase DltB (MBOAT superfamily)